MVKLPPETADFFSRQGFVIVSTMDPDGRIHCSAKGVVGVEKRGKVYLMDLYRSNTFWNLQKDPRITITAIDERQYAGFSLKGKAKIVSKKEMSERMIKQWDKKVVQRISQRVLHNIRKKRKGPFHPEACLPQPQALIVMNVDEIVGLAGPFAFQMKEFAGEKG